MERKRSAVTDRSITLRRARRRVYRNVTRMEDGGIKGEYSDDGARWMKFEADLKLLHIKLVWSESPSMATRLAIWNLSDGYGIPGYVPPQGYDWSGIRDSSDGAIEKMYQLARRVYPTSMFLQRLGINQ